MTATHTTTRTGHKFPALTDAEQLLRDAAFVLRMVRRVKAELVTERPHAARVAASRMAELSALSM